MHWPNVLGDVAKALGAWVDCFLLFAFLFSVFGPKRWDPLRLRGATTGLGEINLRERGEGVAFRR